MTFPELTTWANNTVTLIQDIGGAIAVICVAVIALMVLTSFGNQQRLFIARVAGVCVAIGIFLLLAAPKIAGIFEGLAKFLKN